MNGVKPARWVKAIAEREATLGRDAVRRMAEIYIEEMETVINTLISALRESDLARARRAAHHLATNAGSLDFIDLADLAQRVEKCCLRGDPEGALQALQPSVPLAQRSVSQLRSQFGLE
jgi:HPt (histidine-containing phosphotransfer) domain-containing protein